MPEFYKNYVQDICNKIEEKARMEFLYIWNEHQRTGQDNCVISDKFHLNLIDFPMTWTVFAISYRPPISLKIRSSGKISWRRSFPAPSNSSSALTNFWKEFHKIIKNLCSANTLAPNTTIVRDPIQIFSISIALWNSTIDIQIQN